MINSIKSFTFITTRAMISGSCCIFLYKSDVMADNVAPELDLYGKLRNLMTGDEKEVIRPDASKINSLIKTSKHAGNTDGANIVNPYVMEYSSVPLTRLLVDGGNSNEAARAWGNHENPTEALKALETSRSVTKDQVKEWSKSKKENYKDADVDVISVTLQSTMKLIERQFESPVFYNEKNQNDEKGNFKPFMKSGGQIIMNIFPSEQEDFSSPAAKKSIASDNPRPRPTFQPYVPPASAAYVSETNDQARARDNLASRRGELIGRVDAQTGNSFGQQLLNSALQGAWNGAAEALAGGGRGGVDYRTPNPASGGYSSSSGGCGSVDYSTPSPVSCGGMIRSSTGGSGLPPGPYNCTSVGGSSRSATFTAGCWPSSWDGAGNGPGAGLGRAMSGR